MSFQRYSLIALLMVPGLPLAHCGAADAIGARIDARLSTNRISSKPESNRLSERPEDVREKDQALQTAAKKSEPSAMPAQHERAASDALRARKTRNVVAGQ